MKYGYIYKITHTETGLYYIGKRVGYGDFETYLGSGSRWKKEVLNKYPRESFKKEVLFEASDKEALLSAEKRFVGNLWRTDNVDFGGKCYNMRGGGFSSWDKFWANVTDEDREAFRERCRLNNYGNTYHLGKKVSAEGKKRMSEAKKKQPPYSLERREKMRKSMLGKNKGKKQTLEQRKATSERFKFLWTTPEYREKMLHRRQLSKEKQSEIKRALWRNPEYREKVVIAQRIAGRRRKLNAVGVE